MRLLESKRRSKSIRVPRLDFQISNRKSATSKTFLISLLPIVTITLATWFSSQYFRLTTQNIFQTHIKSAKALKIIHFTTSNSIFMKKNVQPVPPESALNQQFQTTQGQKYWIRTLRMPFQLAYLSNSKCRSIKIDNTYSNPLEYRNKLCLRRQSNHHQHHSLRKQCSTSNTHMYHNLRTL